MDSGLAPSVPDNHHQLWDRPNEAVAYWWGWSGARGDLDDGFRMNQPGEADQGVGKGQR
jgi:hypothetical protein